MNIRVFDISRANPKARIEFLLSLTEDFVKSLEKRVSESKEVCIEHLNLVREIIKEENLDHDDFAAFLERIESYVMRIDNC